MEKEAIRKIFDFIERKENKKHKREKRKYGIIRMGVIFGGK